MSGTDGGFILLHSTCSRNVNLGTDQCDTTFHVKSSKEILICGFLKENNLYTCEAVTEVSTGLEFCPDLHHLVLGSQAGGKNC